MKKVFVFLSVFALTIALFGFSAKDANVSQAAAGELFTEDPTLSENEIPVYVMNSIYTTFPNDYDYAAKADDQWQGAARMYPWNETRLQVKLIDDEGKFTGKEYAIYFSGSTSASNVGTGNNLNFFAINPDTGKVEIARKDQSSGNKFKFGQVAMDPSLSHMRSNISGQDITFDAYDMYNGDDQGNNLYTRMFVLDGQGRMVRGLAGDLGHSKDSTLENKFQPEYCYVDGVVTKIEEGVVCDKAVEIQTDPDTGVEVEVETDQPDYVYDRFLWQWVSEEEFASDEFVGVNEVDYLAEGWDAQKWDYVYEDASGEGYVVIAFVRGEQSSYANSFTLTEAQLAVYTATCEAAGLPAPDATTKRNFARQITVPADGIVFDFGYLDKGILAEYDMFMDMLQDGYKYGRCVEVVGTDAEGNEIVQGMGYGKTCDFSVTPIYYKDRVDNGVSYQLMDGQNTVEVLQGEKFNPTKAIVYTGASRYWSVPNDFTSFQNDETVLDMYVVLDGITVVQPNTGYSSHAEMAEDFMKDFNAFYAKKQGYTLQEDGSYAMVDADGVVTATYVPLATPKLTKPAADYTQQELKDAIGGTGGAWYKAIPYNLVGLSSSEGTFVGDAEMWAKWSWMFEYMNISLAPVASELNLSTKVVASPGNWAYTMWCFLAEAPLVSGWPSSKVDWTNAGDWCDTRTNLEKWQQLEIDTSADHVDKNYIVDYRVKNTVTGNESSLTIKYVVVDEYTPILEVNEEALLLAPKKVGNKLEMPVVDEYAFATAYNARYNGASILGDDISYKIHYSSETLDFDNPVEGSHVVTAKVYNATKYAEKSFTVKIEDMTAPVVYTRDLVVSVGEYFEPSMAVSYAYDGVDGNLLDGHVRYWIDYDGKEPDLSTPGTYSVDIIVEDSAGNGREASFELTVLKPSVSKGDLEAVTGAVSDQSAVFTLQIEELKALLAEQGAELDSLSQVLAGVSAKVNEEPEEGGCGSSGALVVELLAASSLLFVFLRKKH